MNNKLKVYIAGPITYGDQFLNVRNAILAGDKVLQLGYVPFIPHMNTIWHMLCPHPPTMWYLWDLSWLEECDILIRLPGKSGGADEEVEYARRLGMLVFFGLEDFLVWHEKRIELGIIEPNHK